MKAEGCFFLFKKPIHPYHNFHSTFFLWSNINKRGPRYELQWLISPVGSREHVSPVRDKKFFLYLSWKFPAWFGTVNLSSNAADWDILVKKKKSCMSRVSYMFCLFFFFFKLKVRRKEPFSPVAFSTSLISVTISLWILKLYLKVWGQGNFLTRYKTTSFNRNINLHGNLCRGSCSVPEQMLPLMKWVPETCPSLRVACYLPWHPSDMCFPIVSRCHWHNLCFSNPPGPARTCMLRCWRGPDELLMQYQVRAHVWMEEKVHLAVICFWAGTAQLLLVPQQAQLKPRQVPRADSTASVHAMQNEGLGKWVAPRVQLGFENPWIGAAGVQ